MNPGQMNSGPNKSREEMVSQDLTAGDRLPAIRKDIDQARIMSWAGLSGDFNRLHVDPDYARETRFKGTIAHGPMSLGFLNELMMACFGLAWARGGRLREVRFLAPIRPGDRIVISGRVARVTEGETGRDLRCALEISKDHGATVAVTGVGLVVLDGGRS